MARRVITGKRHAQAVFRIAVEQGQIDKWQSDLEVIASVLMTPEVISFLAAPKVPSDRKKQLLDQALRDVSPTARNFAQFLVVKNRLSIVRDISVEFRHLVNAHFGRETAEVTTAVPLADKEKKTIETSLGAICGKQVVLETKTDPAIMGGLIARIGDKLLDGSLRTRLADLRRSLA